MRKPSENRLRGALAFLKVQMAAAQKRELTLDEFAAFGRVNGRKMGDWMRGTSNAPGMTALFELLSNLSEPQTKEVLEFWKTKDVVANSVKTKK